MRSCLIALSLLATLCAGFGQPAPEIVWSHTYGDAGFNWLGNVLPTPDGGFVAGGRLQNEGWLLKVDEAGTQLWSRTYGGAGTDEIRGMHPTPDGGYILCGMSEVNSEDQQAFLVKTNAEGIAQWSHIYGGTGNEYAYDVRPAGDGYVFAGYTTTFGSGEQDVWLVKVNAEGTQQWARTFGGTGVDLAFSIDQAPEGGFYVAGYTTSFGHGGWDLYVIRTDATGEALWAHAYGGPGNDFAESVAAMENGLIVGGVTNSSGAEYSDAWILKLDVAGTLEWDRVYGSPAPDAVMEIKNLGEAGFIFCGVTGFHPYDGTIYRLDPQGNPLWTRTIHNANETWLLDVRPAPNSGYIIAGLTGMLEGPSSGYLIRLAPDGPPPPPEHHFVSVPPTGLPYAVIVDSAHVDSEPLHIGDEIGVFDGNLCVGGGIVGEQWPVSITTWQGDPEQNLPGFTVGHPMQFRLFVHPSENEIPAVADFTVGDGTFGSGVYSRLSLTSALATTQIIPLRADYFELISLNVWPSEPTAPHVFGELEHLVGAYEDNGNVFIPPDIHTLGELHQPEGYRLFTTEAETLRVTGIPLSVYQLYELNPGGWQWISYPLPVPMPIEAALLSIANAVIIVQDADGHVWIPSEEINTIGALLPGKGYMVRVNEHVVFNFAGDGIAQSTPHEPLHIATPTDAPQPTGLPYAVIVRIPESVRSLGAYVVELFDGMTCAGSAIVNANSDVTLVTCWQGVPDYNLPGFVPGHSMALILKDAENNVLPAQWSGSGSTFGEGAYADLRVLGESNVPTQFTVSEGYPNPFNPAVTFTINLLTGGPIEFKVFNSLGQEVNSVSVAMTSGEHRYTLDMRDFLADPVSGMYFVSIRHGGTGVLRKILLLR